MTRLLLNLVEAAETLSMSRASLYRLIRRGEIPVIKIGGMTRIEMAELEQYVRRLRHESGCHQYAIDDSQLRIEPAVELPNTH